MIAEEKSLPKDLSLESIKNLSNSCELTENDYFAYVVLSMIYDIHLDELPEYLLFSYLNLKFDAFYINENLQFIEFYRIILNDEENITVSAIYKQCVDDLIKILNFQNDENKNLPSNIADIKELIEQGFGFRVLVYTLGDFTPTLEDRRTYNDNLYEILCTYFTKSGFSLNKIKDIISDSSNINENIEIIEYLKLNEHRLLSIYGDIHLSNYENTVSDYKIYLQETLKLEAEFPIHYKKDQIYEIEDPSDPNIKSCVASIIIEDIIGLYEKFGYDLFEGNVRYYIGGNSKVAQGIRRTLTDNELKNDFWYFNNGLIIIADSFEIKDDVIILRNPKIINGCQTTLSLYYNKDVLKETDLKEISILSKIISIERKDKILTKEQLEDYDLFILDIIKNSNNQEPIRSYDLVTTDIIHRELQKQCDQFPVPYYYRYKRGQWETEDNKKRYLNKTTKKNNILPMVETAQAYYSITGHPVEAKAKKNLLFERGRTGYYDEIFNTRIINGYKLLFSYLVFQEIIKKKAEYNKKLINLRKKIKDLLKQKPSITQEIIISSELSEDELEVLKNQHIIHATYHIVGIIGHIYQAKYGDKFLDHKEFLRNYIFKDNKLEKSIEKLYTTVNVRLRKIIDAERKLDPTYSHTKFFKEKDSFAKLLNEFKDDIELFQSFGQDPYTVLI